MTLIGGDRGGGPDRAQTVQVRDWVRAAFSLGEDEAVLVAELRCHEEGCPPIETVIAILRQDAREEHRLHRPVAEITEAHVWQLAAGEHGCCR